MKVKYTKYGLRGLYFFFILIISAGCTKESPDNRRLPASITSPSKIESYKKVLVVHSYYPDYGWVQSITRGVRIALGTSLVDLQFFYMDTKRKPSQEWMALKGKEALDVIGQWTPDVVITVDDNAQEYVGKILAQEGNVPVVFCGVNTDPKRYGYPTPNVTGVQEIPHFRESIAFLKQVLGKSDRVRLIVLSDYSDTTDFTYESMKAQLSSDVEVLKWCNPVTWQEWQQDVQESQSRADAIAIYVYHTVLSSADSKESINPKEVIDWTIQNSHIPVAGFLPFAAEDGSLCGVLESGLEQGRMAGQLAMKILNGASPEGLEIQTVLTGQPMLNLNTARNLGIPISADLISQADILVGATDSQDSI